MSTHSHTYIPVHNTHTHTHIGMHECLAMSFGWNPKNPSVTGKNLSVAFATQTLEVAVHKSDTLRSVSNSLRQKQPAPPLVPAPGQLQFSGSAVSPVG